MTGPGNAALSPVCAAVLPEVGMPALHSGASEGTVRVDIHLRFKNGSFG